MNTEQPLIEQTPATKRGPVEVLFQTIQNRARVYAVSGMLGAILVIASIFTGFQLKNLKTTYSMDQFVPEKSPLIKESESVRLRFSIEKTPGFLMVLKVPPANHSTWLTPTALGKLKTIGEKLLTVSGVENVTSLASIEGAYAEKNQLVIGSVYQKIPVNQWVSFTRNNPLIQSQLISDDLRSAMLVVDSPEQNPQKLEAMSQQMQKIVRNLAPDLKVEMGGAPSIEGRFAGLLMQDLVRFMIISLLAFAGIYTLFFKGRSALILTLLSIALSNLIVTGALAWFKVPMTILLSTLPIINSIALISIMIHSLHRWSQVLFQDDPVWSSTITEKFHLARRVLSELLLPNFLGSTTTAIGFIALCGNDTPMIRQYGIVVAIAVCASFLIGHILLLGFMLYTRPILRQWMLGRSEWTGFVLKHSKVCFTFVLVTALGLGIVGQKLSFSARLFDELPENEPARVATQDIDTLFGGVVPYDIVLHSTQSGFWKQPDHLRTLASLLHVTRQVWPVGSALSAPDFFQGEIIKNSKTIAETMFLYSLNENNPLSQYVSDDGKFVRLSIRFFDSPTSKILTARGKITELLHAFFPTASIQEGGLAVVGHTLNQAIAKDLVFGFWQSMLLVGALLLVIFRSLRWALVACIPNLIPPFALMGVLALTHTPVRPGTALIFSIALGLAFNNTVYLLNRLKSLLKSNHTTYLPIRDVLLQEGNPCLGETLIMLCGFSVFLTSGFKINQTFGIFMVISILAGAFGDLVFLPAMLSLFPKLLLISKPTSITTGPELFLQTESVALLPMVSRPPESHPLRRVASLAILFSLLGLGSNCFAVTTSAEANEILKKTQKHLQARDEEETIKMTIIEANGERKDRTMKLQSRHNKVFQALVRIESPADIKGTGFLEETNGNDESQWLYVPSSKQVRRVVGAKKGAAVLGSELTMEDLNATAIRNSQITVVDKKADRTSLQLIPKNKTSRYNRVVILIDTKSYVPVKTEYFIGSKLAKTVAFEKYEKLPGDLWRARSIKVKNWLNKRGTELLVSDIRLNAGLNADSFTVNALKNLD